MERWWWFLYNYRGEQCNHVCSGPFQSKRSGIFTESIFFFFIFSPQTLRYHHPCLNQVFISFQRDSIRCRNLSQSETELPRMDMRFLSHAAALPNQTSDRGATFNFQRICTSIAMNILTCIYSYKNFCLKVNLSLHIYLYLSCFYLSTITYLSSVQHLPVCHLSTSKNKCTERLII